MEIRVYKTYHLVKSEDLNHHGTLYAGRNAEWFVEAGFIAAAALSEPENIVCLTIHGLIFRRPVSHGITVEAASPEDRDLQEQARRINAETKLKE